MFAIPRVIPGILLDFTARTHYNAFFGFPRKKMASPRLTPKAFKKMQEKRASPKKESAEKTPENVPLGQMLADMGVPAARFKGRVRTTSRSSNRAEALNQMFGDALPATPFKTKRRGVEVSPIKQSLQNTQISAATEMGKEGPTFSLWFSGARVLTVNELFSIFQFRRFETYQYKDRWKDLVQMGVDDLRRQKIEVPFFDGPTRLILYRRGTRAIDLDSFQTIFKYAIDGLRKAGILSDDNPFIIVETHPVQYLGPPSIALRLERLLGWVDEEERDLHQEWFKSPDPHQEAIAAHRNKKSVSRSRTKKGVAKSLEKVKVLEEKVPENPVKSKKTKTGNVKKK